MTLAFTPSQERMLAYLADVKPEYRIVTWCKAGRSDPRLYQSAEFIKFAKEFRWAFETRSNTQWASALKALLRDVPTELHDAHVRDFKSMASPVRLNNAYSMKPMRITEAQYAGIIDEFNSLGGVVDYVEPYWGC